MNTNGTVEDARAAAEALEAVAKRKSTGHRSAEDVLQRYLAAEAFHERRRREGEANAADESTP